MKKINKEIQKNVIYDYKLNVLSLKDIAQKHGICFNTARKIIIENGEKIKDFKVSADIEKYIIGDYKNGITNKELTKKYNLHRCTIQTVLLRNGVNLKSLSETARKHQLINENYFNKINTEEKAYILGLLYADGSIRNNGFEITLMETDKELLERLSIIIYNKIILGYRAGRKYLKDSKHICKSQYRLVVTSNIMKNDLIKHGCVRAKTFKIRFPQLNNADMYRHFVRGYFDGDGCFSVPKKQSNTAVVHITSNIYFCDGLAEYIKKTINVNMKSQIRYKNIGAVRLSITKQVIKFMDWLYDDSTIYLTRKHDKFENFKLNYKTT